MNKAIFVGNLTRDPETKIMSNGKARATFTIAVNRTYTNAEGKRDADYIQFVCYEKRAELVEKYLAKGRKVLVEAHVKTGSYEKDGKRVYTTEFIVDALEFLSGQQSASQQEQYSQQEVQSNDGFQEVDDDQLPF